MTMTNRAKRYFAGVQVSPTRIVASICDQGFRLIGKSKRSTKSERGPETVVERIGRAILDAIDESDLEESDLAAATVALSAYFDPLLATAQRPMSTEWNSLATALQRHWVAPVHVTSLGLACAAGVRAGSRPSSEKSVAVIFVEEELAAGLIQGGQLALEFESAVIGKDRWFDWGAGFGELPGKKRYRKLAGLLADQDPAATDLFQQLSMQLARVLTRCREQYKPEVVHLVGLGAEELKPELTAALKATESLGPWLAMIDFSVPAFGFNICQMGAAALAMEKVPAS